MHLLYTRFKSVSPQLAPLIGELERRAQAYPDTLSALLSECHTAYFGARKALLVGRLMEEIKGLDPARTELVELVSTANPTGSLHEFTFIELDSNWLQLSQAVVHRRIRHVPRIL
jgi:hypothetical protein